MEAEQKQRYCLTCLQKKVKLRIYLEGMSAEGRITESNYFKRCTAVIFERERLRCGRRIAVTAEQDQGTFIIELLVCGQRDLEYLIETKI